MTPAPAAGTTRTIAVLTTGRQDWGIVRSLCIAIAAHPDLRLAVVAGGMHLSARHGRTIDGIRDDGFEPVAELAWLPLASEPGEPEPMADLQAGAALEQLGAWFRAGQPDAIVLTGDRFETAAAALAATLARVPIVHLHGGEQTLGAFDDPLRHAITKLAHLHLVSHDEHRLRVLALGEDPESVHVIGSPGLDNLFRTDLPARSELERDLGLALEPPVVVVTSQPATLDADPVAAARAVAMAMDRVPATYVVTLPNADPAAEAVAAVMARAAAGPRRVAVAALGERRYWGLLRVADAMLGNSSSAIVEAPAVRLPAVDVGDRQAGRRRDGNVIQAAADGEGVTAALRLALDPAFRAALPGPDPELVDGRVGERAARIIAAWQPSRPPRKPPIRVTQ
jgi:UDP-hydrolysing UDP-N-acetyl-D-glucosamine 2-epimerase